MGTCMLCLISIETTSTRFRAISLDCVGQGIRPQAPDFGIKDIATHLIAMAKPTTRFTQLRTRLESLPPLPTVHPLPNPDPRHPPP